MISFSFSSVWPCSRMSASIVANRSLVTSSTSVSGTSKSSGRTSTIAFCSALCVAPLSLSSTSCCTPSRNFASSSAKVIPFLTLSANASPTSGSSRRVTSLHVTLKIACLPASCGTEERGGKVTVMSRVSPSHAPRRPSTSPGMNFPGSSGTCTSSPPATAGRGSPAVPSSLARKPFISTRIWLPSTAGTPAPTGTRSAC
mmetsp:Transcript_4177/g.9120  ORF Transcript_4177/g.9120 Transcript_4177/m.9120 type:complete len:200 (-) Transcript_4177:666-1265(-)